MRKPSFILLVVAIGLVLAGCDTFDIIPLSESSDTLVVNLPSGKLSVYLQVWQGRVFDFYQTIETKGEISLYPDSLAVVFKGKNIACSFVGEGDAKSLQITGLRKVRTAFTIKEQLNKGDTISVFPTGYLYSGNQRIDLKPLTLVLFKNLRGPLGS